MTESLAVQPVLHGGEFATSSPPPHREEDPFEIFKRLHRLLRGRYVLACSLAAVLGLAGAFGGWKLTVPKYTSTGTLRVKTNQRYVVYQLDKDNPIQPNSFAKSQANLLQDPRTITRAMDADDWKRLGRGSDPDAKDEFRSSLQVITPPDQPEWIYVHFTDADPKAAQIAIDRLIQAYEDIHGPAELIATPTTITDLVTRMATKQTEIELLRQQIQESLKKGDTTDIEGAYKAALSRFQELDATCNKIKSRLPPDEPPTNENDAEAAPPLPPVPLPKVDPEQAIAQVASVDEMMRSLISGRINAKARLDALRSQGLGAKHRSIQQAEAGLATAQKQIADYLKEFLERHPDFNTTGVEGEATPLRPEEVAQLKKQLQLVEADRKKNQLRLFALDEQRRAINDCYDKIKRKQAELAEIERRHTMLTTETGDQVMNRIQILSRGDEPYRPSIDNRRKLAAFGLMLGVGIPFGACLIWGLVDRRYRYSDDATHGRLNPTLLGILPYLPDNMNDPEQAAVAAHCVHQIRTMLQISAVHEDRRVFAITSPTSGDGKTSLTLSLALSFASSGCNTCMIDFDMVGGGLTSSMDAKTDLGLFDALERGELNGHIRPTSFKRLSLVPVGRNDAQEIARLSPALVRQLIAQARERFDVVIIDTGPILGSIEAPLVGSVADGVILAIGQGQGRAQADHAMESLKRIGATLLGVVFNRAQPGDFRRAVSSASVRSVPNQGVSRPVRSLPALGPMANTVASQSRMTTDEPREAHKNDH